MQVEAKHQHHDAPAPPKSDAAPGRVLITGATGNVGSEVVAACAKHGFICRTAGSNVQTLTARFPSHEAVHFNFHDRSTWPPAIEGANFVFLLRPPPISDMAGTLNPFVDACYAAGVQHIVFLSVAGAERMSWVPHRKVELHLEATSDRWTILRPGFFAQNLQDAYRRDIVEDARLYVPAGNGRVAFVDVRNAAEVAAAIFLNPAAFSRQALTLTGPEANTFTDVAEILTKHLGRRVSYVAASVPGYMHHLRRRRRLAWMQIIIQTFLHVGLRRGDAEAVSAAVERVLGRSALSMESYVARCADVWRAA